MRKSWQWISKFPHYLNSDGCLGIFTFQPSILSQISGIGQIQSERQTGCWHIFPGWSFLDPCLGTGVQRVKLKKLPANWEGGSFSYLEWEERVQQGLAGDRGLLDIKVLWEGKKWMGWAESRDNPSDSASSYSPTHQAHHGHHHSHHHQPAQAMRCVLKKNWILSGIVRCSSQHIDILTIIIVTTMCVWILLR